MVQGLQFIGDYVYTFELGLDNIQRLQSIESLCPLAHFQGIAQTFGVEKPELLKGVLFVF